jgi:protein-S-isoprenylcysteine O-methyltransferase Ste14
MSTESKVPTTKSESSVTAGVLARFAQVAIVFIVQGGLLFLAAGNLSWIWAWIFLGIYLISVIINSLFLMRTSPETVAERGQAKLTKDWDKVVSSLWALFQFLIIPLVAGLDARFGWTSGLGNGWHIAGALVFAAGLSLFGWAMITNAFFSTAVRIQTERGQTVCRSGPYRFLRHPGYLGAILQSIGIPILLGSLWAMIPGIVAAALMVIRTSLEDRTLQAELPGYPDFVQEVPYRLVPRLW